jgi:predicted nucleotidyltransferase
MRLNQQEINAIKQSVQTLDAHAKIYLFGSRVDINKKGGDIDLLILSQVLDYNDKLRIKMRLFEQIEEQKVDIIIAKDTTEPFIQIALEQGILL